MKSDLSRWLRLQWDRVSAWGCLLAGIVTLFVGWSGVSHTAYTAKQLPYLAGCGLGGMFLLGTAAMLWLSADLRDEWRKLDRIEAAIRDCGSAGLDHVTRRTEPAGSVRSGLRSRRDKSPDAAADSRSAVPAGRAL
jgi:hypothetical protein